MPWRGLVRLPVCIVQDHKYFDKGPPVDPDDRRPQDGDGLLDLADVVRSQDALDRSMPKVTASISTALDPALGGANPSPTGARAAMAIDNISPSDEEILQFSHGLELKSGGNLEYHGRKIGRVFVSPFASHASTRIICDKHGSECRQWVNLIEVPNLINCRRWVAMQDVYTSKEKHLEA